MSMLGDLGASYHFSFIFLCFLRKESKCIIAGRQHKQTTCHGLLLRVTNVSRPVFYAYIHLAYFPVGC